MSMKAPLKCKGDPWTKVCTGMDWSIASLDFIGGRKGFTGEFRYNTVCLHVLTGIIARQAECGLSTLQTDICLRLLGLRRGSTTLQRRQKNTRLLLFRKLRRHPQGVGTAGYGLCLSAEDLARIGLLCQNKGIYNESRIVSEGWIDTMVQPMQITDEKFRNMSYGLLWWVIDRDKGIYAAIGNSGNVIYVNPENSFICGVTGYFKPTVFDRIDFIQKHLDCTDFFGDQV